jgi:hypothetical protein
VAPAQNRNVNLETASRTQTSLDVVPAFIESAPLDLVAAKEASAFQPGRDVPPAQNRNVDIEVASQTQTSLDVVPAFIESAPLDLAAAKEVSAIPPGPDVPLAQNRNVDLEAVAWTQISGGVASLSQGASAALGAGVVSGGQTVVNQKNTTHAKVQPQSLLSSAGTETFNESSKQELSLGAQKDVPLMHQADQSSPLDLLTEDKKFADQANLIDSISKASRSVGDEDLPAVAVSQVKPDVVGQTNPPLAMAVGSPVQQITNLIVGAGTKASTIAMTSDSPPEQSAMQILGSGVKILNLALEPHNLGGVNIKLRLTSRGLELSVVAERPETMQLIEKDKAQLARGLQSSGYILETLEIRTADAQSTNLQQNPSGAQSNRSHDNTQQGGQAKDQAPQQDSSNANHGAASRDRQKQVHPVSLDAKVQSISEPVGSNDIYI